jgi:hypothetical protein
VNRASWQGSACCAKKSTLLFGEERQGKGRFFHHPTNAGEMPLNKRSFHALKIYFQIKDLCMVW